MQPHINEYGQLVFPILHDSDNTDYALLGDEIVKVDEETNEVVAA